ncbi:hypothetical protein FCR2A7T_29930 [Flavobacterium cauense R2A-7]|nr:hypothetical protein FCR2A7T_29930 [Flavobacterium cauense R2A-7]
MTDEEMENIFPVSAINDSIIICKKNKVNGVNWADFLEKNKFYTDFTIFNCQTNESIKGEFSRDNSFSYETKSLIIYSKKEFWVYDTIKNKLDRIAIDVYKERIYAENGKIKKAKEFILTPAKYDSKALRDVNNHFEKKKKDPSSDYIVDYLLGAALNGDNISKKRLLDFNQIFPNHDEKNNLDQALIVLKDFENFKKNGGKIKFLDLSQYPKFNN